LTVNATADTGSPRPEVVTATDNSTTTAINARIPADIEMLEGVPAMAVTDPLLHVDAETTDTVTVMAVTDPLLHVDAETTDTVTVMAVTDPPLHVDAKTTDTVTVMAVTDPPLHVDAETTDTVTVMVVTKPPFAADDEMLDAVTVMTVTERPGTTHQDRPPETTTLKTSQCSDISHVCPSVDGDDDDMSAVFEFPGLSVNNLQQLDSPFIDRDREDSDNSQSPNGHVDNPESPFVYRDSADSDYICSPHGDVENHASSSVVDDNDNGHEDSISVSSIQISGRDKNSKNRRLPCFFCDRWLFHMSRHLSGSHRDETAVAAASVLSSRRKLQMQHLINQGIYKHNVEVLRTRTGTLVVGRASKSQHAVADYVPCPFCLHFYISRELYRHCRKCKFRPVDGPVNGFNVSGRALLHGSLADACGHIDESLFNDVIQRMQSGKLLMVVKNDSSILELGSLLLEKLGNRRALDISARMRELARLMLQLRTNKTLNGRDLSAFLSGKNFDKVLTAIEAIAEPGLGPGKRKIFKRPGFVINIGGSILKCAHLKRGRALRAGDRDSLQEVDDFVSLYTMSFTDRMASAAHASYKMKGNQLNVIPDEDDMSLLRKYQVDKINALVKAADETDDDEATESNFNWRELAEVTLSRVL